MRMEGNDFPYLACTKHVMLWTGTSNLLSPSWALLPHFTDGR